jgi:hypothetical protein
MNPRQAQVSFLKDMILQSDREESRRLFHRIHQAEQHELASRRWTIVIAAGIAIWWTVVALATQGWSWVWRQSEHPVAVVLLWMGGIALFSLLLVCGCWLWHRTTLRRIVGDTQRFLAGWLASRNQPIAPAELRDAVVNGRGHRVANCMARRQPCRHSCNVWMRRRPPAHRHC